MSQEQRNSTTPSNEPTALTQHESGEASVVSSIDKRIIQANNPQDIPLLTQARGEIIRQDEGVKDRKHQRFSETVQLWCKMGFPVLCFIAGIVGVVIGGLEAGYFISGVGLSLSGVGLYGARMFFKGTTEKGKGGENAEE